MAFQEFMIAPVGAESMAQAIQIGSEVYQELKSIIKKKYGAAGEYLVDSRFHQQELTFSRSNCCWRRGRLFAPNIRSRRGTRSLNRSSEIQRS